MTNLNVPISITAEADVIKASTTTAADNLGDDKPAEPVKEKD